MSKAIVKRDLSWEVASRAAGRVTTTVPFISPRVPATNCTYQRFPSAIVCSKQSMRWRIGQEGRDRAPQYDHHEIAEMCGDGLNKPDDCTRPVFPEHQKPAQTAAARSICEVQNNFSTRAHVLSRNHAILTNEKMGFKFLPDTDDQEMRESSSSNNKK